MTDQLSSFTAEQREGHAAYMAGKRPTANPYPWDGAETECKDWARGYAAARTDKARAKRRAR